MIDRDTGYYFMHTSVKVVITRGEHTLVAMNPRQEWELIGGWPDQQDGELTTTAAREVLEETGAVVSNLKLLDARIFEPVPERKVVLIVYTGEIPANAALTASEEHKELRWFHRDALPDNLPATYQELITLAFHQGTQATGALGHRG